MRALAVLAAVFLTACAVTEVPNTANPEASNVEGEAIAAGEAVGDSWEPSETSPHNPMPERPNLLSLPETERKACESDGGSVERRGMMGSEMCVRPYVDAGKACTDESRCEGRCIAEGRVGAPPDEKVTGICQRDDKLFGCFGRVENGTITGGICVD